MLIIKQYIIKHKALGMHGYLVQLPLSTSDHIIVTILLTITLIIYLKVNCVYFHSLYSSKNIMIILRNVQSFIGLIL